MSSHEFYWHIFANILYQLARTLGPRVSFVNLKHANEFFSKQTFST